MTDFRERIDVLLGEFLSKQGFVFRARNLSPTSSIEHLFYSSAKCKLMFYSSPRGGEINCMLGSPNAPDEPDAFGKQRNWFYLPELTRSFESLSPAELSAKVPRGFLNTDEKITRIRGELSEELEVAIATLCSHPADLAAWVAQQNAAWTERAK